MPILQCLGKALLDGGAAAEAEAVYRNDLRVYPENGWGLTGLAQAMEAQGKPAADVAAVREAGRGVERGGRAAAALQLRSVRIRCAAVQDYIQIYYVHTFLRADLDIHFARCVCTYT